MNTFRQPTILLTAALLGSAAVVSADPPESPARPNVVLIMADDMGYSGAATTRDGTRSARRGTGA